MLVALIIIGLVGFILWENCPKCNDSFVKTNLHCIADIVKLHECGCIPCEVAKAHIEWHLSHILKAQPARFGAISYGSYTISRYEGKLLTLAPIAA